MSKAVEHLIDRSLAASAGKCAAYTRRAIEAGGVTLARHVSAKNYGSSLIAVGFVPLVFCPVRYVSGDVVVIKSIPGHPHGHMAMFDGQRWISDFVQKTLYPGPSYRKAQPDYTIYRHPDAQADASAP